MTKFELVLSAVGGTTVVVSLLWLVLGFLLKTWVSTKLTQSIASEYQRGVEKYKSELLGEIENLKSTLSRELESFKQASAWEQRRKEQSAYVADVLSLWCAPIYGIGEFGDKHRHELQRRWWTLAGWLDKDVFHAVQTVLMKGDSDLNVQKAIVAARRVLAGADDPITPEDLVFFPKMPSHQPELPKQEPSAAPEELK